MTIAPMLVPGLFRLLNRVYPGGFGRKTIAGIGRRWLPRGRRVPRARVGNGFYMSLALDQYIDSAIYFHAFEYSTVQALKQVLSPGDTAIDVGANIGYFTLLAGRLVGSRGRVVAFEPNPEMVRRLTGNVALNDYQARVTAHPWALSDVDGPAHLYVPTTGRDDPGEASMRRQRGWDGVEEQAVVARRLDDLWDHGAVRLIKLDVEGAELQVLQGAREVIRIHRPHVICEYNPSTAAAFGYEPAALAAFFRDIGGYALHALASRGIVHDVAPDEPAATGPKVENWWFAPRQVAAG